MNHKHLFPAMRRMDLGHIPENRRSLTLCLAVRKHMRTHGPGTRVYMRTSHGRPDAVILMFNNNLPEPHHRHIEYIPAEEYLEREGNEVLASFPRTR